MAVLASAQVNITYVHDDAHFWSDSEGAHVTHTEEGEAISGGNTLITEGGMEVRDGDTTLASFKGDGVVIGQYTSRHAIVDNDGLYVALNNSNPYFYAGYSSHAIDSNGNKIEAPFFTFGLREIGKAIGAYSVAEGSNTTASGSFSHAEGAGTEASEWVSHAEGTSTEASGFASHAEGSNTIARGRGSHAQNIGTIAAYYAQTAIGKYNANSESNAFELGNGTSYSTRSNAFTVDWSGNITTAGLVNKMQAGSVSLTPGSSTVTYNGVKYYTVTESVTFDTPFDSAPHVILSPSTGVPHKMAVAPSNITETGFTINFFRDSKTATGIHWIAMGGTQ